MRDVRGWRLLQKLHGAVRRRGCCCGGTLGALPLKTLVDLGWAGVPEGRTYVWVHTWGGYLVLDALEVFNLAHVHVAQASVAQEPPQPQHLDAKRRHDPDVRGGDLDAGGAQQLLHQVHDLE